MDDNDINQPARRGRPPKNPALQSMMSDPRLQDEAPAVSNRTEQRQPMRRRKKLTSADKFYVDQARIPAGMTYEWRRHTIVGQEDREHMIDTYENGFTPVPAERHPELAGMGAKPGQQIERGGLVLMERPAELRDEALAEYGHDAKAQTNMQMRRLKLTEDGQMDRVVKKASRSYGPGALAVDD